MQRLIAWFSERQNERLVQKAEEKGHEGWLNDYVNPYELITLCCYHAGLASRAFACRNWTAVTHHAAHAANYIAMVADIAHKVDTGRPGGIVYSPPSSGGQAPESK